ncbi:MAG TPA: BBE domain-containing protein, partial [Marmoricola sp.]|nr:BBE domain-containing protein [Marmoricola sp.]
DAAPDELTTALVLMPGFGAFPAGAVLYVCYCGDDPGAIDPLRSLGTMVADTVAEQPYSDVLEEAHPPPGILPVIGNTLVEDLSAECIDAITAAYDGGTAGRVVFIRSLGGALGRVDPDATAFAHRSAQAMVVSAKFLPLDAPDELVSSARAEWQTIGRHGIGAYAGFLGSATDDDIAALWPAGTLARLREVKQAWDPDNVFRRNFNVRP